MYYKAIEIFESQFLFYTRLLNNNTVFLLRRRWWFLQWLESKCLSRSQWFKPSRFTMLDRWLFRSPQTMFFFLKKWAIPGLFLFYFHLFNTAETWGFKKVGIYKWPCLFWLYFMLRLKQCKLCVDYYWRSVSFLLLFLLIFTFVFGLIQQIYNFVVVNCQASKDLIKLWRP